LRSEQEAVMIDALLPLAFAIGLWWASTGVILYLDGLPAPTFAWSLAGVVALGCGGLAAIIASAGLTTVGAAYAAFAGAILVWAVPTAAFYFGTIAGPRRAPADPDAKGWTRFVGAAQTMLYHEGACLAGALTVAAATWGQANKLALWCYLLLWAMHLTGKLNMYFGVPNLSEEFIPPHLRYLVSYMRRRPMNLFFPFSVTAATLLTGWFAYQTAILPTGGIEATAAVFLATLSALALLEHWLLVLPLRPMALWTWSLASREPGHRDTATREPACVAVGGDTGSRTTDRRRRPDGRAEVESLP
jgi:putative photosynthetic complex assembly protein 2